MDNYQTYITLARYTKHIPEELRRESWNETVCRWGNFFGNRFPQVEDSIISEIVLAILNHEIMPSMRTLWTAGAALERDNAAGYNCFYLIVNDHRAFDEAMYLLMCGAGVGFSVERQFVSKLPKIAEEFYDNDTTIVVKDSKMGWASALRQLISLLYVGEIPKWDMSKIRAKNAPLKTFGGRASGYEPLEMLFKNVIRIFSAASGRKLYSIEAHDILCFIADTVNVGGVRRSACISLTNLSDDRMRIAKSGNWQTEENQRRLANISTVYTEKPDFLGFMREWLSLYESKAGERGIINRKAFQKKLEEIGREYFESMGVNPCGEVILRAFQACNLSEIIAKHTDTLDDLKRKVRLATIVGTLQSDLTNFRYLRKIWQQNCEEERLLGVSITGIMDNPNLCCTEGTAEVWLKELKDVATITNIKWAKKIGISPAKAITCIKPSGTVSQLVNSSSGIHPRFSEFYKRVVINDINDPLGKFMADKGVPHTTDKNNYYFEFPQKAPKTSKKVEEVGAMEQLKLWKVYATTWCDHNPSQTIYYTDDEFLKVGQWVWENFDIIGGLSFFPVDNHIYEHPPYTRITESEYKKQLKDFPSINWGGFKENLDMTTGAKELACGGGQCEV